MEVQPHPRLARSSLRWPFRILAATVVLAGVAAVAGAAVDWSSHDAAMPKWQMLAALPGVAWLIRLAWASAVHGRSATPEFWPFASQRVFTVYIVLLLLASYL